MAMENSSVETEKIVIEAYVNKNRDNSDSAKISKKQVIRLLKKHGVKDTETLETPDVKKEDIIPTLRKAKVKVPEAFFKHLAAELGVPFLKRAEIKKLCKVSHECRFLTVLPYRIIEEYLILPMQITEATAKIALANPLNHKAILILQCLLGERQVTWCVASSESIDMAIEKVYREIHVKKALMDLYYRNPDESAHKVLFPNQKYFVIGVIIATVVSCTVNSALTFAVLFAAVNVFYFLINPVKLYISVRGLRGAKITSVSQDEIKEAENKDLPVYTILIPVYHESSVLPQVMRNVYQMDYPKEKLDAKILMEEKDEETVTEARKLGLFGDPQTEVDGIPPGKYRDFLKIFEPVVIPEADITTKPRACNYGLLRAKGKYCVIYDAEDNPGTDQLKKAAVTFSTASEAVACLQSKLNFYNAKENLLSRWFSIEYSYWYDYYLPGLDMTDAPIPLGGTSNHFRTTQLRELGGWDPYNVTEDADLGVRLSRRNLKTQMLDSYTYEEATIKVPHWIRQRSRWYKGHVQTYLVHMRHPKKLLQDLGWKKFLLFQLTFGGTIFMPIINPVLWLIAAISLVAPWVFSNLVFTPLQPICIFNLVVGNVSYILFYLITCIDKKSYKAAPLALAMPAYWVLISIAAWRGLLQLITKPFYWEKTLHGVSKSAE
jgi:cellulose synthase/poly-beta-1,6-N-acetylglucosamine synthase-like glycosyltransferase